MATHEQYWRRRLAGRPGSAPTDFNASIAGRPQHTRRSTGFRAPDATAATGRRELVSQALQRDLSAVQWELSTVQLSTSFVGDRPSFSFANLGGGNDVTEGALKMAPGEPRARPAAVDQNGGSVAQQASVDRLARPAVRRRRAAAPAQPVQRPALASACTPLLSAVRRAELAHHAPRQTHLARAAPPRRPGSAAPLLAEQRHAIAPDRLARLARPQASEAFDRNLAECGGWRRTEIENSDATRLRMAAHPPCRENTRQ
jgi:hypothetical protein